jgi:hypothetical protein
LLLHRLPTRVAAVDLLSRLPIADTLERRDALRALGPVAGGGAVEPWRPAGGTAIGALHPVAGGGAVVSPRAG